MPGPPPPTPPRVPGRAGSRTPPRLFRRASPRPPEPGRVAGLVPEPGSGRGGGRRRERLQVRSGGRQRGCGDAAAGVNSAVRRGPGGGVRPTWKGRVVFEVCIGKLGGVRSTSLLSPGVRPGSGALQSQPHGARDRRVSEQKESGSAEGGWCPKSHALPLFSTLTASAAFELRRQIQAVTLDSPDSFGGRGRRRGGRFLSKT